MKRLIPSIFLLAFVCFACQNQAIMIADTNQIVVNAFLKVGDTVNINITRQFVFDSNDSIYEPISGLDITLNDGISSYSLTSNGSGNYSSKKVVESGKSYTLLFTYNGKQISSKCTIPNKPVNFTESSYYLNRYTVSGIDSSGNVVLKWSNPDSGYYFVNIYCTEYTLKSIQYYTTASRSRSIDPSISDSLKLTDRLFSYYGTHRLVLYHVNKEYFNLFKRFSSNAESLTNAPTNITNGLGIFTGFATDTLWVSVRKAS